MIIRKATQHDVADIMAALRRMKANSPAIQMKYTDEVSAECGIRHAIHEGRGFVVDQYFIMVDVGKEWYSSVNILIEQIILKLHPTPFPVTIAIEALDLIAAKYGCALTAVGDAQVGYMTPFYHALGFQTLGTQLIKENHLGICSQAHGSAGSD